MPGFRTHIAFSSAAGVGYALLGANYYDLPYETSAFAGGLCAIGGIMPDLDSDSGVPSKETIGFAAAVIPMLVFNRLHAYGLTIEQMVMFGAPMYLIIRFGFGSLFKSVSVHRGMFHSIPAVAIAGLIGYLICDSGAHLVHNYKACAVALGYLIHLILDEIWSIDLRSGNPHIKKSFGTALKFFGDKPGPAMLTYCLLCTLMMVAANEEYQPVTANAFVRRHSFAAPRPIQKQRRQVRPVPLDEDTNDYDTGPPPRSARRTRMDDPWQ